MTTKKNNRPVTDHEKQFQPMPGEVTPDEAQRRANLFAAQEKARNDALKTKRKK